MERGLRVTFMVRVKFKGMVRIRVGRVRAEVRFSTMVRMIIRVEISICKRNATVRVKTRDICD